MEKTLKRTGIVLSTVIVLICVILAIGSTFSIFTGSTDSDINVNTGEIKLGASIEQLETYSLGVKQDSGFANLGTAEINGATLDISNMTPGDAAKLHVVFDNQSTIAIAYRIKLAVDGELAEALKITITQSGNDIPLSTDATDWVHTTAAKQAIDDIVVSIELPKETTDDYQSKNATIAFQLEALQSNVITDKVSSADELEFAIKYFDYATVINSFSIEDGRSIVIPAGKTFTLDLNGYTISTDSANPALVVNGNLTVIGGSSSFALTRSASTTVSGSITNAQAAAIENNSVLTLNGGSFTSGTGYAIDNTNGTLTATDAAGNSLYNANELTLDDCRFDKVVNANTGNARLLSGNNAALTNEGDAYVNGGTIASLTNSGNAEINSASIGALTNSGTTEVSATTVDTLENSGEAEVVGASVGSLENSGKMTVNAASAANISNTGAGELVLNNATVNATEGNAVYHSGASLEINGGSFTSTSTEDALIESENDEVTINSGSFTSAGTALSGGATVNGGSFEGVIAGTEGNAPEVYGGTFKDDSVKDYLAYGHETDDNGDGSYNVQDIELVKIGKTIFPYLQDAIDYLIDNNMKNQTITLLRDVVVTEAASGGHAINVNIPFNLTIDLAGHSISADTGNSVIRFNITGSGATSDVTLTVKNGTINAGENTAQGILAVGISEDAQAILTLNGVTVNAGPASGAAVRAYDNGVINATNVTVNANATIGFDAAGGEINLNDCTVTQTGLNANNIAYSSALSVCSGGVMNVNSGTYTSDTASGRGSYVAYVMNSGGTLNINGGSFTGNVGDEITAANACGIIGADNGAVVVINEGYFHSNGAILDMRANVAGGALPQATLNGGIFTADPCVSGLYYSEGIALGEMRECWNSTEHDIRAEGYTHRVVTPAVTISGSDTVYYNHQMDDAIAAWTAGKTMTLVYHTTLPEVVKIKSTEHHILDLSTYTLYAAAKQNAIEITPEGAGTAARSCLTINADATNPGGITATGKACIYYRKTNGINDRLMVTINGGIFNGSNAISSSSNNGGQACPYYVINGGTFNASVNLTKAMLKVTGGTFNGMFSCTGDSTAYRLITGGTFKSFTFMTADAATKFAIGSAKSVYDKGLYVDDNGYLVVGGPVITEAGDEFEAVISHKKWCSMGYLQYSSAKDGLYCTSVEYALGKCTSTSDKLTVFVDELDLTGTKCKGTIDYEGTLTVTFEEGTTPAWTVLGSYTETVADGVVTRVYTK